MAAPTRTNQSVELWLKCLRLMLGDLPEIAEEWDELSDGERVSWSLDWDQIMASDLPILDRHFRAGAMTTEQETRYRALLCELKAMLPTIQRLQLYPPPVPLEAVDAPGLPGGPGCG